MAVVDSHQAHLPDFVPPSPFYSEEHEAFRDTVRRFVDREIMPHVDQWDEAEEFPRELYRQGLGRRPAAARLPRGIWRRADRSLLRHHQGRWRWRATAAAG